MGEETRHLPSLRLPTPSIPSATTKKQLCRCTLTKTLSVQPQGVRRPSVMSGRQTSPDAQCCRQPEQAGRQHQPHRQQQNRHAGSVVRRRADGGVVSWGRVGWEERGRRDTSEMRSSIVHAEFLKAGLNHSMLEVGNCKQCLVKICFDLFDNLIVMQIFKTKLSFSYGIAR